MLTLTLRGGGETVPSYPSNLLTAWAGPQQMADDNGGGGAVILPGPRPSTSVPGPTTIPRPTFNPPVSTVPPPIKASMPPFPPSPAQVPYQIPVPYAEPAQPQAPVPAVTPQEGKPVPTSLVELPAPSSPALPGVEPVQRMPTWLKWTAGVVGVTVVGGLIGIAISR